MLKRSSQGGVVLITALFVSIALIILAVGVIQTGYYFMVTSELRSAVSAAAYTSARQMCSTNGCYQLSHFSPLQVVQTFPIHSGLGRTTDFRLNITAGNSNDTEWQSVDGLGTFGLEIGRWLPSGGFEPFDKKVPPYSDPSWQSLHPGVPLFTAMNAVHVYATRQISSLILQPFIGSLTIRQEMTVVAEMPKPHNIAPLAIPVCSIINQSLDFNPSALCFAERYFTAVDRYCGGAPCNKVPSFTWEPVSPTAYFPTSGVIDKALPGLNVPTASEKSTCESTIAAAAPGSNFNCDFVSDSRCNWDTLHFPQTSDNYGVIGVPAGYGASESAIAGALQKDSIAYSATQLNDTFQILPDGLKESSTEDKVWEMMSGSAGGYVTTRDYDISYMNPSNDLSLPHKFEYNKYIGDGSGTTYDCSTLTPSSVNTGICNSRRFGPHPKLDPANGVYPEAYRTEADRPQVWLQEIPVIADWDHSADTCTTGQSDNIVNPSGDWRIIGYVRADIFDVDIGNSPPVNNGFNPSAPFYDGMIWPYPTMPTAGAMPWGFPDSCNLIRAFIGCGTDLLPGNDTNWTEYITGPVRVN